MIVLQAAVQRQMTFAPGARRSILRASIAGAIFAWVSVAAGAAIQVDSFEPKSGVFGTMVDIRGPNLGPIVRFNGIEGQVFAWLGGTRLLVEVPRRATTGPLTIATQEGEFVTAGVFTITQPTPLIHYFTPTGSPGKAVLISFYEQPTSVTAVAFNGKDALFARFPFNFGHFGVLAIVPAGATSGPITVTTHFGAETTSSHFTVTDEPIANAPSIASFSPAEGSTNSAVVIEGSNLDVGIAAVLFNGTPARFVQSGNHVIARVPPGASSGPINILTATGAGSTPAPFVINPDAPASKLPRIIDFWPKTGGRSYNRITIVGLNLTNITLLKFNDVKVPSYAISVDSDMSITVTVPDTARTGPITIETSQGSTTSSESFQMLAQAIHIRQLYPQSGAPGTPVNISFDERAGTITSAKFNGVEAAIYPPSAGIRDMGLTAVVPTNATTGPIVVMTALGTVTSQYAFMVHSIPPIFQPRILSITPESGPPGTEVLIKGERLSRITTVRFGSGEAQFRRALDPTTINAVVPTNATTGPISVILDYSTVAQSPTSFTVTDGPRTPGPPEIFFWMPNSGPIGSEVSFEGFNISLADVLSITFNGEPAVVSYSTFWERLAARVPGNARSGPITITTKAGSVTTLEPFFVTSPRIDAFSPSMAPVNTSVTITGTNFAQITSVKLNQVAVPFTIVSSTEIRLDVPLHATTGPISIAPRWDRGTSTGENIFRVVPTLDPLRWTNVMELTRFPLTGSGFSDLLGVELSGIPLEVRVHSPTELRVFVPEFGQSGPITLRGRGASVTSLETLQVIPSYDAALTGEGPVEITPGQSLTYRFTASNGGRIDAPGVVVRLSPPSEFSIKSVTTTRGVVSSPTGLVVNVGALAKGDTAEITLEGSFTGRNAFIIDGELISEGADRAVWNNNVGIYSSIAGSPRLGLRRIGADTLEISWPVAAEGFHLENRLTLRGQHVWTAVTEPVTTVGADSVVTVPFSPHLVRLFRLVKP